MLHLRNLRVAGPVLLFLFRYELVAAEEPSSLFGPVHTITAENLAALPTLIKTLNHEGRGTLVLTPDVPRGPLPVPLRNGGVRVIDLRYGNGVNVVRGNHPRSEGFWPQYSHLGTGLARNLVLSDVIDNSTPLENWKSEPAQPAPIEYTDPYAYASSHNHYQNLLSEVWSFSNRLNAVAIWGDSGAFAPRAAAWGGFFSARSWPVHWQQYVPPGTPPFKDEEFDAALVGVEIDVLNAGCDAGTVSPLFNVSLQKIGCQIVGFGKRNGVAVEVRCEDTDIPRDQLRTPERRGAWNCGIFLHDALHKDSTVLLTSDEQIARGIDLGRTRCTDGALRLRTDTPGTGIVCNDGNAGEIYGDADGQLTLRAGAGGLQILSPARRATFRVDEHGAVHLDGDVYLAGRPVTTAGLRLASPLEAFVRPAVAGVNAALAILSAVLVAVVMRLRSRLRSLEELAEKSGLK